MAVATQAGTIPELDDVGGVDGFIKRTLGSGGCLVQINTWRVQAHQHKQIVHVYTHNTLQVTRTRCEVGNFRELIQAIFTAILLGQDPRALLNQLPAPNHTR